ncbi:hypothetical protein SLEP1_g32703 [Rubroshorea leprosula]|uniref:protein-disulfide reductase n=2 Tax=Rubroshorea leprosula TaxID=152421 RepID=A0AAV5KE61_9ROSI|nr:hypothetical protein SLEP1_g32703 [Rubroshorea leprosula]
MPWLAIPFSDSETHDRLKKLFEVAGIPHLVILDEEGKVSTEDGVEIIQEYGVDGYPFSAEKIKELKEQEEKARREQSLRSILVSPNCDFVISSDGNQVPVSELEGKTVGLYFAVSSYPPSVTFTPKLVEAYNKLKEQGESFEIVLISLDDEEESFKQSFGDMPWLSLPFKDKRGGKLLRYFELSTLPTLVIIGPDGKTLHPNVAEAIEEHGHQVYPFTPEKFAELAEIEKAKEAEQTLESILVSGDLDFVIGKDGAKILVSDLVGKNILLYFSAHWCPPCRAFLPKLIEAYHKIKAKDEAFEVIFISTDWEEMAKGWPEKVKHPLHEEHELILTRRRFFNCDGCEKEGRVWSYYCKECDFDLHPNCALKQDEGADGDAKEEAKPNEGLVCEGGVCKRV